MRRRQPHDSRTGVSRLRSCSNQLIFRHLCSMWRGNLRKEASGIRGIPFPMPFNLMYSWLKARYARTRGLGPSRGWIQKFLFGTCDPRCFCASRLHPGFKWLGVELKWVGVAEANRQHLSPPPVFGPVAPSCASPWIQRSVIPTYACLNHLQTLQRSACNSTFL